MEKAAFHQRTGGLSVLLFDFGVCENAVTEVPFWSKDWFLGHEICRNQCTEVA